MAEIEHGDVVLYSYLWGREYARGEESGRKARPCCVIIILRGPDGRQTPLIFPITSKTPLPQTRAIEIPETEARRVRLTTPAWVIVDEFNTDDFAASFSLEDREPLGAFSRRFVANIAAGVAGAIRAGVAKAVPRR